MGESFMDKIKNAAGTVASGAKGLANSTKLKVEIMGLQDKVKNLKHEFGVTVYDMMSNGTTSSEAVAESFVRVRDEISKIEVEIAEKQAELVKIG